jgi:hypothetical protein
MKEEFKFTLGFILGLLVLCFVIDWFSAGEDFFLYKYWTPKHETINHQIYRQ